MLRYVIIMPYYEYYLIKMKVTAKHMNTVLTIAGSDCSGGAGIQADLKTIMAHGAYGMSVITALTAQNTQGILDVCEMEPDFIGAQLDAVFTDIFPKAVKIGMIPNVQAVRILSEKLCAYQAVNLVIDPVMGSTSGTALMEKQAFLQAQEQLYPLARLLTPNIPEAEALSSVPVTDRASMQHAAEVISAKSGCAVLVKGGHLSGAADDLLYDSGQFYWFEQAHIDNPNTHGTGCTLSAAIACRLAEGLSVPDAAAKAKQYVTQAISAGLDLGHGSGPLNHGCGMRFFCAG